MPVKFVRRRVQYAVEFEYTDRVMQFEATSQDDQPLLDLRLRFLCRLGKIADLVLLFDLVREISELTQRVPLGLMNRLSRVLHLRPGDLRDPTHRLADAHCLPDREIDSVQARQHLVRLGAKDVVELLVDRGEIVRDLVHLLLHRNLRHDPGGTRQHRRVGHHRSG